ncbi:MAG: hypothetical protein QME81_03265 [bacterium]|nr:hypothetical protein [bacterium]
MKLFQRRCSGLFIAWILLEVLSWPSLGLAQPLAEIIHEVEADVGRLAPTGSVATGSISGKVIDASTGRPIADCELQVAAGFFYFFKKTF